MSVDLESKLSPRIFEGGHSYLVHSELQLFVLQETPEMRMVPLAGFLLIGCLNSYRGVHDNSYSFDHKPNRESRTPSNPPTPPPTSEAVI